MASASCRPVRVAPPTWNWTTRKTTPTWRPGSTRSARPFGPKLIWFNLALTVGLLVMLGLDVFPLALLFMIAAAIALVVNFPNHHDQSERVKAHASSIVAVVAMVFAAAVLVGVLEGTGMVTAMADAIVAAVPPGLGPWFAVITGLLSMPFTFFMSNDAFYFGVLPILSEAAGHYGISPVEMAQASIVGQPVHLTSPLGPGDAAADLAGQGRPRRLPQEGHLAGRRLLAGDARGRHRPRRDPDRLTSAAQHSRPSTAATLSRK